MAERLAEWPDPQPRREITRMRKAREKAEARGERRTIGATSAAPAIAELYRDEAIPITEALLMIRGGFRADAAARTHGLSTAAIPMLRVLAGMERIELPGLRCTKCLARLDRSPRYIAWTDDEGRCWQCCRKPRSVDIHVERTERARVMLAAGATTTEIAEELGLSRAYFESRYLKFIRQIAPGSVRRER